MILNGFFQIFICGLFGGLLGELHKWYRLRTSQNLPKYTKSAFYWLVTSLIIISGGILSALYGTEEVNAILAVNIGLSAPLIIQTLAKNKIQGMGLPKKDQNHVYYSEGPNLRNLNKLLFLKFLAGE